ncbi:MAG TPA: Sec-independent protein translocase subunit TatA [Pseudonocardia sp.]|nr:Sec-independent protein translocase subunit TatA [Pseudonocardia sp.]
MPGGMEWVILLVVVVLLFGAKRLPELARSVGRSARVFRGEIKGLASDGEQPAKAEAETAPEGAPRAALPAGRSGAPSGEAEAAEPVAPSGAAPSGAAPSGAALGSGASGNGVPGSGSPSGQSDRG